MGYITEHNTSCKLFALAKTCYVSIRRMRRYTPLSRFSRRLGHVSALTAPRAVIHYRNAATKEIRRISSGKAFANGKSFRRKKPQVSSLPFSRWRRLLGNMHKREGGFMLKTMVCVKKNKKFFTNSIDKKWIL